MIVTREDAHILLNALGVALEELRYRVDYLRRFGTDYEAEEIDEMRQDIRDYVKLSKRLEDFLWRTRTPHV